ncbi:MAG: stage V sporulation protein AD [Alicyclobacillaceae bacterium]|nr:stage V sporulation protein AD [Alicyclobacillaceae bacterium]
MPRTGKQTWTFSSPPRLVAVATVAGRNESEGPLGQHFDIRHDDDRAGFDTWEHAEQALFDQAANLVLKKAGLKPEDVDLMVGGDLNAQLTAFYLGLRPYNIPALGVYSACASFTEAMALAGLALDAGMADRVMAGTSSHYSTAERQFRFPTEYGVQKPPTAQRTATGAGMALLAKTGGQVALTEATIGQMFDFGVQNPWEMGAAMAPAAAATIRQHLADTGRRVIEYDCIATGDLGHVGHRILRHLLAKDGLDPGDVLTDCGMLLYRQDQPEVFSGGSGGACSTLVTLGYFVSQLETGRWRRVLVAATGALLSAVSTQQKDSVPGIAHAIVLERKDG